MKMIAALIVALISGVTVNSALAAPPAVDRAQIESIIREYLLQHPEVIPEALEALETRERDRRIASVRTQLETPFEGAWMGNPQGDVIVVEFFDYACGFCRRAHGDIDRLLAEDPKVKVVFREFPILGPDSVEAARTALQAARQGQYAPLHQAFFTAEKLESTLIQQKAAEHQVKLPEDLGVIDTEIGTNHQLAKLLGISGTPAFIINGRFVDGAVGYDALKALVAELRDSAGKLSSKPATE